MIEYDPEVIQKYATRLYRRANSMMAAYALAGLVLGGLGGTMLGEAMMAASTTPALIGAAIGAVVGWMLASARAETLKLMAQQALCHVRIEQNTRSR